MAKALGKVVDEEGDKVGRRNVFVGGHGMGCAIGFAVLLYLDAPVGGFFGAAPFMLFADTIDKPATKPANKPASVQKQDHVFKKPAIPPRAAKDSDLAKAVDPRLWLSYFQARDDPQQPTGQQPTTTPSPSTPAANKDRLHEIVGLLRSYSGALGKKALETMQRLGFRASLDLLDVGQHEVTTHMIEKFLIEFLKTRGSG